MRERRVLDHLSARCAVALSVLLVGACANGERTPGAPWLLGATALSLAGMPPEPPDFYEAPVRVSETLRVTALAAGADHTCALDAAGDTYCWGSNQQQQLGTAGPTAACGSGALHCSSEPVRIEGVPRFTALAASLWGTCGLDAAGRAYCWGGQSALPAGSGAPVEVASDLAFVALSASAGGGDTCGLTRAGEVWCWSGSTGSVAPRRIATSPPLVAVSFSGTHGCGIDAAGDAYCWGNNQFGQLGIGSSGLGGGLRESAVPLAVQGGTKLESVAVGAGYSCGLGAAGAAYCWGQSFADASAAPRAPDRLSIPHGSVPVRLEGESSWFALAAGTTQACGLSADGRIGCFTTTPSRRGGRTERVASEQTFVAFAVGGQHACAIGADALVYCWGSNHAAQAGRPPTGRRVR